MPVSVLLSIGWIQPMTQNIVYALPARACRIQVSPDTATLVKSVDGIDFDTMALTEGGANCSGAFIKATSGNVNVDLTPL
jgi:hypothetical protein